MLTDDELRQVAAAMTLAGDYIDWLESHAVTHVEEDPEDRIVMRDEYRDGFHDLIEMLRVNRALNPVSQEGT